MLVCCLIREAAAAPTACSQVFLGAASSAAATTCVTTSDQCKQVNIAVNEGDTTWSADTALTNLVDIFFANFGNDIGACLR
jgi:ABC-type proline/glycine betaine transport system substrate-binding protein